MEDTMQLARRRGDPRSGWALGLGVASVLGGGFFTGVPAVVVGNRYRRSPEAAAQDDALARVGVVLGWVGSILMAVGAVFLVGMLLIVDRLNG